MSYFRTGDPLSDFHRLDQEEVDYLERLPNCEKCGCTIDDDHYFEVEGEILCEACMIERYRRNTEDFVNNG
jgi:hypothetical protein